MKLPLIDIEEIAQLAIVEEAVKHNPIKVRELMAEHLGYHKAALSYREAGTETA